MDVRLSYASLPEKPDLVLRELPAVLGRGSESTVRLEDRWLSRRHCELSLVEGLLHVRDLGSKHGTFVNGERIAECTLYPGDRLQIGLCELACLYEPDSVQIAAGIRAS